MLSPSDLHLIRNIVMQALCAHEMELQNQRTEQDEDHTPNKRTLCIQCLHCSDANLGRNYCYCRKYPRKLYQDPVTGQTGYQNALTGDFEELKYPPCSEINKGYCPGYAGNFKRKEDYQER